MWMGQESLEETPGSCAPYASLNLSLSSVFWSLFREELLLYKTPAQSLTRVVLQGNEQPSM